MHGGKRDIRYQEMTERTGDIISTYPTVCNCYCTSLERKERESPRTRLQNKLEGGGGESGGRGECMIKSRKSGCNQTCSGRSVQFDDDLIFFSTRSPSHKESAALAKHLRVAMTLPLKMDVIKTYNKLIK